ncbi:MAG: hypothetical protein DCC71_12290 [Proteobacteria bacterium]|nr:MAG: hypothetical protein DCC71_12290 [Pseudomonadota bacterium]
MLPPPARRLATALAGALLGALAAAPAAHANCNLIPAAQREFRSVQGTVDRTLVAPGLRVAVRADLACDPGAAGFDAVAASNRLFVRFVPPGSDADPSLATELEIPAAAITPSNCATGGRCDTLLFSFPDAATLDAALPPDGDGRGPTGPVRIRVENLAASVLAEIGPLFEPTLACDDQQPESVFGHLTALPPPNDFGTLAAGSDTTVEATIDGNGNLLIPIDYGAVRILEGNAQLAAFASAPGDPILVPASRYLRSFNLAGRPIPPVLETNGGGDSVLGSVDAQLSVLRLARLDPDAPSAPLYDLTDRLANGRGPIVITGATAAARESAPLATLSADPNAITFARLEGLEGDLNGDGDSFDRVPQVIQVATGAGSSTGLAVTEVTLPGFARPVLASGDGFVAFGVSEGRQGYAPLNADGDPMDSLLRVFDTAGAATATGQATIDPEPRVDGKPLAISNGLVFFRSRESDGAVRETVGVTPTLENVQQRSDSIEPVLSRDGRFVAFLSSGGSTFGQGFPTGLHVFVYDRETGDYELIDRDALGVPVDVGVPEGRVAITADGRYVIFSHGSNSLPGADADAAPDAFVHDRQTQTTTCATCALPDGNFPYVLDDASHDGRFLLFRANYTRLDRQTSELRSVFAVDDGYPDLEFDSVGEAASLSGDGRYVAVRMQLRAIQVGTIANDSLIRFDLGFLGYQFGPPGSTPSLNADGSVGVFMSDTDLTTDDTNLATDAYVWDLASNDVELVSLDTAGQLGSGGLSPRRSSISDDGRFVAYVNDSGHEVPGLGGASRQVYRVDRASNVVEAVSVSSAGQPSDGFSNYVAISGDGRSVAVAGFGSNLAPDFFDNVQNVVVRGDAGGPSLNAADADASDTVLEVFDAASQTFRPSARVPADVVVVAAGRAGVLSSEADDGGLDRNGDGDAGDRVARIVDGLSGAVAETGLAASAVAISEQVACIAVNEAAHGASDLNGDGDSADDVLFVRVLATGDQTDTQTLVDPASLAATGARCVFTTPEQSGAGSADLNGDGDEIDAVLRVYDAQTAIVTTHPYAASDLVARGDVVAFRVCEADQGESDLNFDGDNGGDYPECIMHVLLLATGEVQNTERAALPCTLPGCDPFFEPYRVSPNAVSFLTSEAVQSGLGVAQDAPLAVDCKPAGGFGACDLSGDADADDSMISVYGLRTERAQLIPIAPLQNGSDAGVSPFPTEIGDSGVLYVQVLETQIGEDVNGDGEITNAPVLVLVGDADGDGTLDDAANDVRDTCIEVANPDQTDADRDRLGDDACDPAPTPSLPGDVACDVDRNGQVDRDDANRIFGDRGAAARASDPRDPDGDGQITVLDVSACRAQCSYDECRTSPPVGACGFGAEIAIALAGVAALRRRRSGRRCA